MITKTDLLAMQNQVLAYGPDERIALSDASGLLYHGIVKSAENGHFDVSATLFAAIVAATGNHVALIDGQRMTRIGDRITISEGTHLDIVKVDGLAMYTTESMRVRYELKGRGVRPFASTHARFAYDLGQLQAKLDNPPAAEPSAPVAPAEPDFGVLTEAETAFLERYKRADWYYSYSDDPRVYRAGKAECEALEQESREHGGKYAAIHQHYSNR
jgi:hypothetical protein